MCVIICCMLKTNHEDKNNSWVTLCAKDDFDKIAITFNFVSFCPQMMLKNEL